MAFVVGSYQAIEHPGAGHRAGPLTLWRGEDLRSGDDVAMTMVPAHRVDDVRAVAATMGVIRHPHLLPVIDVLIGEPTQDAELAAVVCPWPAGGRLAELVARRGRLTAGESLTVLIPLADALAAAHAGSIRHGDVCPETIWFDDAGRPLLGPLAVSAVVAQMNDGLPEGSRDVAPELVRGEAVRGGPVTRAADVFSLGSVALYCLTGRSAWPADDHADVLVQSAAGVWPDLPDDAAPGPMLAVVRAMLRSDPGRRPSAANVAAGLSRIPGATAIDFGSGPALAPASADRWRGWSADSSVGLSPAVAPQVGSKPVSQQVSRPVEPGVVESAAMGPRMGLDDQTVDADQPPGVRNRGRRGRSSPLVRTGIGLLVGLLVTVIAVQVGLWWTGWDRPVSTAEQSAGQAAPDWLDVIVDLDAARGRALAAADPALLADVYVPESPAALADEQTITRLADQGLRVLDGRHEIVSVTREEASAAADASSVRLTVVDVLPTHPVVDGAGQQVGVTAGRSEQTRVLVLITTDAGYRISGVEPG